MGRGVDAIVLVLYRVLTADLLCLVLTLRFAPPIAPGFDAPIAAIIFGSSPAAVSISAIVGCVVADGCAGANV